VSAGCPSPGREGPSDRTGWALLAILFVAALGRIQPIVAGPFPPGNDHGLHLWYAEQYQARGFPPGAIAYYQLGLTHWPHLPGGPMFFGFLSMLSGLPVFATVGAAAALGAIEAAGVFALALRISPRVDLALFAAAVTALLPGPLEMTGWGAYPNLVGLAFLPGAFAALLSFWSDATPRRAIVCALAVSAVAATHHLSALWLGLSLALFLLLEFSADARGAGRRLLLLVPPLLLFCLPMIPRGVEVWRDSLGSTTLGLTATFAPSRASLQQTLIDPAAVLVVVVLFAGLAAFFLLSEASLSGKRLVGSYLFVSVVLAFGWVLGIPFHYWRSLFFFNLPAAIGGGWLLALWKPDRLRSTVAAAVILAFGFAGQRITREIPGRYQVLTPAVEETAQWIRGHSDPDDVVLASNYLGFHLIRLLERPLMVSVQPQDFFSSNPEANAVSADAASILEGADQGDLRLDARRVRYVVIRARGSDFPEPPASQAALERNARLHRVFANTDTRVYEVRR
jgi:hypothetical protein